MQQVNTMNRPGINELVATPKCNASANSNLRRMYGSGQRWIRATLTVMAVSLTTFCNSSVAQVYESFDSGSPTLRLGRNDCSAEVFVQQRTTSGGRNGGPCELVSFRCTAGTRAELVYTVSPVEIIDELSVSLWFWSHRAGSTMSTRVRFPFAINPADGQPLTAWLGNAAYSKAGQWEQLDLTRLRRELNLRQAVLRRAHGQHIDLRKPYIDAVVVNAYTGPGSSTVRFDDLRMTGALSANPTQRNQTDASDRSLLAGGRPKTAFPVGKVQRILEYNGESIQWVRNNGFTGILCNSIPSISLLKQAGVEDIDIIAPAEMAFRTDIAGMLGPVIAWNLGGVLLNKNATTKTALASRLRRVPQLARRELIAFPIESHRQFSAVADCVAIDVPAPTRGLLPHEELALIEEHLNAVGTRNILASVTIGFPESLNDQLRRMPLRSNQESLDDADWHATWIQVMRALEICPRGIVFRSNSPLDSGSADDQRRATQLRLINSLVTLSESVVSGGAPDSTLSCNDANYRARLIRLGRSGLIVATSTKTDSGRVQAGSGKVLKIHLPASLRGSQVARITELQLTSMTVAPSDSGPTIDIVAPDFAELLIVSSSPATLRAAGRKLQSLASGIVFDRWQLASESLHQTSEAWHELIASGNVNSSLRPIGQLEQAGSTLEQAWAQYQSGDIVSAYRSIRRSDAWDAKSTALLLNTLSKTHGDLRGHPLIHAPRAVQSRLERLPYSNLGTWKLDDAIVSPFRHPELWSKSEWSHDVRREDISRSHVQVVPGAQGWTQISLSADGQNNQTLPGGYAGTTVRVKSCGIPAEEGEWLRIDATIKISGDQSLPHRGALVYETMCGAEMGVFVRPSPNWQQVTLYRIATDNAAFQTTFELLGEGELLIGEFAVSRWTPNQRPGIPFRPLISNRSNALIREPR